MGNRRAEPEAPPGTGRVCPGGVRAVEGAAGGTGPDSGSRAGAWTLCIREPQVEARWLLWGGGRGGQEASLSPPASPARGHELASSGRGPGAGWRRPQKTRAGSQGRVGAADSPGAQPGRAGPSGTRSRGGRRGAGSALGCQRRWGFQRILNRQRLSPVGQRLFQSDTGARSSRYLSF